MIREVEYKRPEGVVPVKITYAYMDVGGGGALCLELEGTPPYGQPTRHFVMKIRPETTFDLLEVTPEPKDDE